MLLMPVTGASNPWTCRKSYYRARYYDAITGRFLNEDPVRFASGHDFYTYVRNNPTLFNDPTGEWVNTKKPIDPKALNPTIVCDGHGGIRVWFPDTYMYPKQRRDCIGDCTTQHEESHKRDALRFNPQICEGSPDGIRLGYSNAEEEIQSETVAWIFELRCLENKKKDKKLCPSCASMVNDEIDHAFEMLRTYNLLWRMRNIQ